MSDRVENFFIWITTGFMVGIVSLLGYGIFLLSVPPLTYGPLQSLFPSEARPGEMWPFMAMYSRPNCPAPISTP